MTVHVLTGLQGRASHGFPGPGSSSATIITGNNLLRPNITRFTPCIVKLLVHMHAYCYLV